MDDVDTPAPAAPRPSVHPRQGLPEAVRIYEVGPRDGLQAEKVIIDTAVKLELVQRLERAGMTTIELTSFVPPRWVPQLADAENLMAAHAPREGVRYPVLVPNLKGLARAKAAGAREIAVVVSSTEAFAKANFANTIDGALDNAVAVVEAARADGLPVRGYVSMAFGDPWEGAVAPEMPARMAAALSAAGCTSISLGDTIGVGTAGQVADVVGAAVAAGTSLEALALHFHDTYGQALSNVLAGLEAGVTEFDASAGGLGGCPYARSATGNLATEDLVWLLEGLGYDTGIDLDALVATSTWMAGQLGRAPVSRVVRALAQDVR
ncbi:hydroxymethylglutaryl-CoA lyase [Propionibacteriaceae bacterium Y1685]|uniref:hydroxymethylglutaryl-CoA lyase n=1 Tax=Microlunatus sp. Y1700 TaxID=3418487 RepID=UPI003B7786F0